MKKINKKGFTLIELLAVIVVLAVVMLIAVNAVIPQMDRARKQAFLTEATTIIEAAETYFMYHEMTGNPKLCVDVEDLIGEYVDEKGKGRYDGVVYYAYDGNHLLTLTNGDNYYLITTNDKMATLDAEAVKSSEAEVIEGAPIGVFEKSCVY